MADPKADPVLYALEEKLARYEAAGMADQVEAVKARIASHGKGAKPAPAQLTAERTRRASDVATLSQPAKKATKRTTKKKA